VPEYNDPSLLAAALGDITLARGMSAIAQASGLTREALYKALRPDAQPRFDTVARVCTANPEHPSLRFKKVHASLPIYAVRIDHDWRAVGVLRKGGMVWFWIGSHGEYENLLSRI